MSAPDLPTRARDDNACVDHLANELTVVDLPARHREIQWTAFAVDDGVDFRGVATAADADRLILLPLCPAGRTVGFHNRAVDQIQTIARFRVMRNGLFWSR